MIATPEISWLPFRVIEATPWGRVPRFLIRDRDRVYGSGFPARTASLGIGSIRTPVRAPRANAVAERLVGTLRRECCDHLIVHSEQHVRAVLTQFVAYYNAERPHQTLALDTTLLDQKQLAWVETTLRDAKEDWKIPYFHHPLYSNADRHGASVDIRVRLEPLFIKYGVNVVFAGHDHVYERIKPQNGIYYFVSGAAGQLRRGNMRPNPDETAAFFDQDQSFMLVEIAGAEMYFQSISRTGKIVDSGMIPRQEKRGESGQ